MSTREWIVEADDGRSREVESREEAEKVKNELEDLGMDVEISRIEISEDEDERDIDLVEGSTEDSVQSDNATTDDSDISESIDSVKEYDDIKSAIIDEEDIQTTDSGEKYLKKSGWRKIAKALDLNVEVLDYNRLVENDVIIYIVKAGASSPNGRTATAIASAQSTEPRFTDIVAWETKTEEKKRSEFDEDPNVVKIDGAYRRIKDPKEVNEHDLITLAATRAKNRAISDLVGGGEASAEEIDK